MLRIEPCFTVSTKGFNRGRKMTWTPTTNEQRDMFRQTMLWVRTVRAAGEKYGNPFYGADWLPSDADFDKSALLERIRSGLAPMDEPPPVGFACPWYALVEDAGPHWLMEVWFRDDLAIINQNAFTVYERTSETDLLVGDRRGTSYRFRLWQDPDWRHPSGYRPDQGGWFIQNVALASGTLPRENTEECSRAKPSGLTAESGDAQPTPVSDPISNKGER